MTKEQARLIMEAHYIVSTLGDREEMKLLEENNPELAEAYYAFHRFAYGADGGTLVINEFKRKD